MRAQSTAHSSVVSYLEVAAASAPSFFEDSQPRSMKKRPPGRSALTAGTTTNYPGALYTSL
jgi:hypothetical protein